MTLSRFCTSASMAATALIAGCALPADNTLNRADLRSFAADEAFAERLAFTDPNDIPTGSADYTGHMRSNAIVNGNDDFVVAGLMDLNIDIANGGRPGSGRISGRVTDLNLFDEGNDGFDDQGLDGSLSISGRATDGRLSATATGVVGAVLADVITEQKSTWQLNLDGDFRGATGDIVSGAITGGTSGAASDDYDILLTGDGRFYGELD